MKIKNYPSKKTTYRILDINILCTCNKYKVSKYSSLYYFVPLNNWAMFDTCWTCKEKVFISSIEDLNLDKLVRTAESILHMYKTEVPQLDIKVLRNSSSGYTKFERLTKYLESDIQDKDTLRKYTLSLANVVNNINRRLDVKNASLLNS